MPVFKCKMCGGSLNIPDGLTAGECVYCGTKQTLPRLDDDRRVNLYDRANHFRRNNDFDKAAGIYEQILSEDSNDAEAYWSLVLCRFGIEYVEDPATHRRVPTVNRTQFTSVFDDDNYKSALEHADSYQRTIYENEAKTINEIQKGILDISQKEEPFDVFICYKETDNNGQRTPDSVLANDLYHQLTQEGFKVFFSRITLEDKLGTAYEPYIFAALNSAKVMIVLGTKPEYFNAVWVKNEWSRYLSIVGQSGGKKVLIPAYKDMDPYDLPEEFSHLQAQDMSKLGFMQDLIRGIKKIIVADDSNVVKKEAVASGNVSVEPLLKRVFMFLEDGDWESANEYCEKVLDQDPENAQAYLGKLMSTLHIQYKENLADCEEPFDDNKDYQKAVRFGDDTLSSELCGYNNNIVYNRALLVMNKANSYTDFENAADAFMSIIGYRDAETLVDICLKKKKLYINKRISILKQKKKEKENLLKKETEEKEKYNKKINAIIEALKQGNNVQTPKQRLDDSKMKLEKLLCTLDVFDELMVELSNLKNEHEALLLQENSVSKQREKLGIFAGREKKRLDEELLILTEKQNRVNDKIKQNDTSRLGYLSKSVLEKDIIKEKELVSELEKQIEKDNEIITYSFSEALKLYMSDSDIALVVNKSYPKAVFLPCIHGLSKYALFGKYCQKQGSDKMPIRWQVLKIDGDKMLLISQYVLDCKKYNSTKKSVSWESCSLRKWLNDSFLSSAFSDDEKTLIIREKIRADQNPYCNTFSGEITYDYVFLLSVSEVVDIFKNKADRIASGTEYSLELYDMNLKKTNRNIAWWLRTPGKYLDSAAVVSSIVSKYDDTMSFSVGFNVNKKLGVRPAIWVDIS